MKKLTKILISLLLILVIAAAGLFVWQYDNISALINGLSNSSEDLAAKMDEQRNKLKAEVEKYVSKSIEDISAEDEQKLLKGELTIEEIADKYNLPLEYMKDDGEKVEKSASENTTTKETDTEINEKVLDEAISSSVSKMYALKAKYVSKLGELEKKIYEEYKNLPKEKQNKDGKYAIIKANLADVANLEKKCDDEVAAVLADLKDELEKYNGDKEIIKILQDAYEKEKEVKKAYYLSLYND